MNTDKYIFKFAENEYKSAVVIIYKIVNLEKS